MEIEEMLLPDFEPGASDIVVVEDPLDSPSSTPSVAYDDFVQIDDSNLTNEADPAYQSEILYNDSIILHKLDVLHNDLMMILCVLVLILGRTILSSYRRHISRR